MKFGHYNCNIKLNNNNLYCFDDDKFQILNKIEI